MKTRAILYVFSMSFLSVILFSACQREKPLARVGNHLITNKDFNEAYREVNGAVDIDSVSFDKRLTFLNKMVDDRLKIIDAIRNNLDAEPSLSEEFEKLSRPQLYQAVLEEEIVNKVIPEELILKKYEIQGKEVKLAHIFLPVALDNSKAESLAVYKLVEWRKQIKDSEDFATWARQVSKDSLSAGKSGYLGFVKYGARGFGSAFYDKVFSMRKGEISNPIRSEKGIHLVLVSTFRSISQPPIEAEKEVIKRQFFREKRDELNRAYIEYEARIKESYEVEYIEETIQFLCEIFSKADPVALGGITGEKKTTDYFPELKDELDRPLVKYKNGALVIKNFFRDTEHIPVEKLLAMNEPDQFKGLLERLLSYHLIIEYGIRKNIDKKGGVKERLERIKDSILLEAVEKLKIKDAVVISENELMDYYKNNLVKYNEPPKFRVHEIYLKNADLAIRLTENAKSGGNFDELARKYNERTHTKKSLGDLGYIRQDQYGNIGKIASQLSIGQVYGPIDNGNGYSIIRLNDKTDERQKEFEEVRRQIESDLTREKEDQTAADWLKQLKNHFIVQIYKENLKTI